MEKTRITIPDLAREVADNTGCGFGRAEAVIKGLVDVMGYHLRERGERLYLKGLGMFELRATKPKRLKNNITNEYVTTRHTVRAAFRPAKTLRRLEDVYPLPKPVRSLMDECPF